jgi:hypothetical protein
VVHTESANRVITTANQFLISMPGNEWCVLMLRPPKPGERLSKEKLLNLVAWATVLLACTDEEIAAARREIEAL